MKVRFWIKSNRGTNESVVETFPNWEGLLEKELEARIKSRLEAWCSQFGAWDHGDNVVSYGYEIIPDPQLKLEF